MNCRQGDLAIVVKSNHPINIGRIVDVLGPSSLFPDEWLCRGVNGPLRGFLSDGSIDDIDPRIFISDSHLRPIRPEPDPLERTTERGVTA